MMSTDGAVDGVFCGSFSFFFTVPEPNISAFDSLALTGNLVSSMNRCFSLKILFLNGFHDILLWNVCTPMGKTVISKYKRSKCFLIAYSMLYIFSINLAQLRHFLVWLSVFGFLQWDEVLVDRNIIDLYTLSERRVSQDYESSNIDS